MTVFVAEEIRTVPDQEPASQIWLRLRTERAPLWLTVAPDRAQTTAAGRRDARELATLVARDRVELAWAELDCRQANDGQVWFAAEGRFERAGQGRAPSDLTTMLPLVARWVNAPPEASAVLWTPSAPTLDTPLVVVHTDERRVREHRMQGPELLVATFATPLALALDGIGYGLIAGITGWCRAPSCR